MSSGRVIVCGSRTWGATRNETFLVYDRIGSLDRDVVIVHGGARGADALAADAAKRRGNPSEAHPADWDLHGRRAGLIRNEAMASLGADLCIAFWDGKSRGTFHMLETARRHGIPTEVVAAKEPE